MTAAVSVIIPHYDDLARLDLCLAALEAQDLPRDAFEIVVADNASPAGLAAVEAVAGGRARVVLAAEKGAGPARNAGVAASKAPLLAFTDCDCVPAPGWLSAGLAALETCDLAGGRMVVSVTDERAMTGAEAFEKVFAFDNRSYVEKKGFSVTANLFCGRAVFDATGPFRTGVSEDVEWCHRAGRKGYRLGYAERAVVAHPARRDWGELKRKWQRMNVEGFGLAMQGGKGRLRWIGRNLTMPLSIVAHAPRVLTSPLLPDAGARARALAMLARVRLWRMTDAIALAMGRH